MSDQGEKTCPLCAEEMDLTDQQLKPCKCGYQICVWCWHHIMDMAEKDETEGRCPACRTPYNKEKVVGTAATCERLVSEMNMEKKLKSQRGKSKTSEGRKQLSSVRVIQRNLVYIVGLPLALADEDQLLQRKEYFGQYGKVLKVSISRTASGSIQQFANSTCSVYITYSKEEEAVRCIQSVHGFVLEGRSLRACFGTTKYCHAWLRNMPCTNPDCLYLHEIGSQEDSFTKDEIISAYTRSRVQQISGVIDSTQRRSGNVLPPPVDDYCSNSSASSGKPSSKTTGYANNSAGTVAISPPNSSSGRSAALPAGASWGARTSNNQSSSTSLPVSNGPPKQKFDSCNGQVTFLTTVASGNQVSSLHKVGGKKFVPDEESNTNNVKSNMDIVESVKKESNPHSRISVAERCGSVVPANSSISRLLDEQQSTSNDKGGRVDVPPNAINSVEQSLGSSGLSLKDPTDLSERNVEDICSNVLSMSIDRHKKLQNGYLEHKKVQLTPQKSVNDVNTAGEASATSNVSDKTLGIETQETQVDSLHKEDDLLSFNNERLKDPEVSVDRSHAPDFAHTVPNHSNMHFAQRNADVSISSSMDKNFVNNTGNSIYSNSTVMSNGHDHESQLKRSELLTDANNAYLFQSNKYNRPPQGRLDGGVAFDGHTAEVDMGEDSIISNILSLDFESWDESITSPQNLAKLLGETDKQSSLGVPNSRKIQSSNQSRFSFAREDHLNQGYDFGQTNCGDHSFKQQTSGNEFTRSNSFHAEKFGSRNGFSLFNGVEPEIFSSNQGRIPSNKFPVSRPQVAAPPGFAAPSRVPPPGFTSHERTERMLDTFSGNHIFDAGNHMFDASSFLRNQYQTPSSDNAIGGGDIEFMDPAILAVGKGTLPSGLTGPSLDTRPSLHPQLSMFEDARYQSLLQRSNNQPHNQRFNNIRENFSPLGDAYGVPSTVMEQTLANNFSPFSQFTPQSKNVTRSNGQWDGWNDMQGGNNGVMAELLRNERLGFNKLYSGYEDSKIRMQSSSSLYNGTYGI